MSSASPGSPQRNPRQDPKRRLLEAVIGVALADGIADKSLRAIAEAAGTSHRMLIHHFGSKEGLWVAIVREVERRQLESVAELVPVDDDDNLKTRAGVVFGTPGFMAPEQLRGAPVDERCDVYVAEESGHLRA